MRTHLTRRRIRAVAGASIVALALSVSVPEDAVADPNPEPINPFYFTAPELPAFDGIPFGVRPSAELPRTVADLRSGEPTCPAPPLLAATDSSSPEGYTLPVRIKLTNGTMLAGYTPSSAEWKQGVPFSLHLRGMTGWVNARVQLPSMKLLADPDDVTICDGARLGIAQPGSAPYPEWDWAPWNDPGNGMWILRTQPDGSQLALPPGVFDEYTYSAADDAAPGRRLDVENVKVNTVDAALAGLRADGALDLQVDLDLDLDVVRGDHADGWVFPLGVTGTFTTAVKAPFAPATSNVPWNIGRTPPAKHRSYLPSTSLTGAIEGERTTVGSTDLALDVSGIDSAPAEGKGLAANIYMFLYGVDPWGVGIVADEPDNPSYYQWSAQVIDGSASFFPPDRGVADVSVDMTVDRIDLPKGVPTGYGYDG